MTVPCIRKYLKPEVNIESIVYIAKPKPIFPGAEDSKKFYMKEKNIIKSEKELTIV